MAEKIRIGVGDIEIGTALQWAAYDSSGTLLLRKGTKIQSGRQLEVLLHRGLYRIPPRSRASTSAKANTVSPFTLLNDFYTRLSSIFNDIHEHKIGVEQRIIRLAKDIQKLCDQEPDALLGAIHLYDEYDYVVSHPVHSAILGEIFTHELDFLISRRLDILCATLTSNISVIELQQHLHAQSGPMTLEQRRQMQEHPTHSAGILKGAGITNERWINAVLQHHERKDGSGYPLGLVLGDIHTEAKILALTDIYTAMAVTNNTRKAHAAKEILRELFLTKGKNHDEELCLQLIKILGVFPPGSFVRLENGELAVVIQRANSQKMWPIVSSISSDRGSLYANPFRRDCNHEGYKIKEMCFYDRKSSLNLDHLWNFTG